MSVLLLVPSSLERAGLPRVADRAQPGGVGLVDATARAVAALAARRPARCVLAGLAGTRDPERVPPGALVVGTAVRNEAVGAGHGAGFQPLGGMGLPDADLPPDLLPLAAPPRPLADARPGVVGTVASSSGSAAEARERRERAPDVLVEEMEGHGVAWACARAGVPLLVVRAVSNVAGERDKGRWCVAEALAALDEALASLLDDLDRAG